MHKPDLDQAFWKTKRLAEMTPGEWESLCDGCAKCCLNKLEDAQSGEIFHTDIACRYLEQNSCRCSCYQQRQEKVPQCVWLKPEDIPQFSWLPESCAYRLIHEGKDLPHWHPLISGDAESVHRAGYSVRDKVVSEEHVHPDEWDIRLVRWVDNGQGSVPEPLESLD